MLSKFKQINWTAARRKTLWYSIFATMMALLAFMLQDMAKTQPVIFGLVMLAAVVGGVSFDYVRRGIATGAYVVAFAALMLGILGISVHSLFELSYWPSVVEDINDQVQREQAAAEGRAIVFEKRKQRYAVGGDKSPEQLAAEVQAAEQNPRWLSSNGCTNATVKPSQEFCENYYKLKADLASAKDADKLEGVIWNTATNVEVTDIKRNLARGAILISDLTGWSVSYATNAMIITIVIFIQAVLAFSMYIGNAPEKHREAVTVAKSKPEAEPEAEPKPPVSAQPEPQEKPTEIALQHRPVVQMAVPLKVREDPHRKLAFSKDAQFPKLAFANEEEAKPREEPVKPILTVKESNRVKKAKAKGKKHKLSKQVINWLCETTTGEPELSIPSGRCFDNYVSWCRQRGEANVGFRVFTGIVKEELRLDDAKRNNGGQTMLPIKLSDPRQWSGFAPQRRKAA